MKALLEVKEGERLYKTGQSEWMMDSDGAVLFRMISKQRADGQVEVVFYTLRGDGLKRVVEHISFAEKDFWSAMDAFQSAMEQFFPKFKMEYQNIDLEDNESYHVKKNTKANSFMLMLRNKISSRIHSIFTYLRKK